VALECAHALVAVQTLPLERLVGAHEPRALLQELNELGGRVPQADDRAADEGGVDALVLDGRARRRGARLILDVDPHLQRPPQLVRPGRHHPRLGPDGGDRVLVRAVVVHDARDDPHGSSTSTVTKSEI
jgi:hypothetical protein